MKNEFKSAKFEKMYYQSNKTYNFSYNKWSGR